jgi:dTDP-4-amino-4,6-dideoxygalactose transaminase
LYLNKKIAFNQPFFSGKESQYLQEVIQSGRTSGNGRYTALCQDFFQKKYGFHKCFMTTSCTDAIEMSTLLMEIKEGDEIIVPSYTFVSTANPFMLRGASIVFCDSNLYNPNIDADLIEELITPKTKAIAIVHYAGIACDMEKILSIVKKHNLFLLEDAAQAVDSFHGQTPLGSFGHFSAFSFHETKNISSGEGGMLVIKDPDFIKRAEVIWDKGTNRSAFFRGDVQKYNWVNLGSSFLPSELTTSFLYAQLECLTAIQSKRKMLWQSYFDSLQSLEKEGKAKLPVLPGYATNNAQIFYLVLNSAEERDNLMNYLKKHHIQATFHYQSLHKSPFYSSLSPQKRELPNADKYSEQLIRLPLHFHLETEDLLYVTETIKNYWK